MDNIFAHGGERGGLLLDPPAPKTETREFLPHPRRKGKPAHGSHLGRLAASGEPTPVKRLLDHVDPCWLFEVEGARYLYYAVEREDRVWNFAQLFRASSKFLQELEASRRGAGPRL
jgi:hypothetical protein